jgi:DNA-binding NarL/FixJ family response regulator
VTAGGVGRAGQQRQQGTRRLLEERDELKVVGVASDFDSVLAEARRLLPDVIVMDIKDAAGLLDGGHRGRERDQGRAAGDRCGDAHSARR